ncbi:hypothetical protein OG792_26055 [Micromonospora sp. NBC_01699]|uniref:hypothetical protein n=1 Tax=Micromonospora sp. NBC_01699 TaxID=2975984 RepID=UPI002E2E670C|nr:hypothetical protein [Micromonospora sp. NBC_01699]
MTGMSDLERRYRWLLRAYPRAYRQYRAEEMLDTLLGVGESDRRHLSLRESMALVVGGLRVRTGVDRFGSRAALLDSALRLTVLSLLVCGIAVGAQPVVVQLFLPWIPFDSGNFAGSLAIPGLLLLALASAAWARYRLAFAMAVGALGVKIWYSGWYAAELEMGVEQRQLELKGVLLHLAEQLPTWAGLLAVLTMVPLLRSRQPRAALPWLWLVGVVIVVTIMTPNPLNGWQSRFTLSIIVTAGLVAALVGAVFDVRISIVASGLLLVPILSVLSYQSMNWQPEFWELSIRTVLLGALAGIFAINVAVSTVAARQHVAL